MVQMCFSQSALCFVEGKPWGKGKTMEKMALAVLGGEGKGAPCQPRRTRWWLVCAGT